MGATITVKELLLFILAVLGMGVLAYLILLIRNTNKLVSNLGRTLIAQEENLNRSLETLPKISENVNGITDDIKEITTDLNEILDLTEEEIVELVHNANSFSNRLDNTSENVFDTIDTVSESVSESAMSIETSVKSMSDYIIFIMDVIDIIKKNLNKR